MPYQRKLPTTGYWVFVCNTGIWAADEFLATGEDELWYRISNHQQHDFRAGQLGVLRLNEDRRSKKKLKGRPALHAGIYAIFQVVGDKPRFGPDGDSRFHYKAEDAAKSHYQVRVRIVANLLKSPALASTLPRTKDFQYIRRPLQTPTIALSKSAFERIASSAHWPGPQSFTSEEPADTAAAVRQIEDKYADAAPEIKYAVSRRIERGPVGNAVKAYRGCRCQLCEALNKHPVAFLDKDGTPFAEAHHTIPVARGLKGSLSPLNIMVLCPNHHRQAHYGDFIALDEIDHWLVQVDGASVRVDKPPARSAAK